ncbi:uncharacterized protein LOC123676440 [Harmonia axyridis]|uniref:uncharacterized protein LOC123676440 n=1 Tax=Harmonia axyridis TaxID=115357 RepID=UPI001E279225|nr:uncharacterized protein LOC123676440 [Harmonia axyridis]
MKYFVVLVFISVALSANLPEGTKLCHKSDNFNECLKDALEDALGRFAKGFKPLGIKEIDPLTITEFSSENEGFSQFFKNVKIHGGTNTKFRKVRMDWDKLELYIESFTPHSEMIGDYSFKGTLISFSIDSAGKFKIVSDNILSEHHIQMERFQKNGKNHIRIVSWKIKNKPTSLHYSFDNLIPGNEELSKTIMNTMNENALQIYKELGGAFDEVYGEVHKTVGNQVFGKIPEDELFLP